MTELEQVIKNLDRNLRLLIKKNKRLEQELSKLKSEKQVLENSKADLIRSLEQIGLQNSILKASQQSLSAEEKKAAEKQIQHFLNEIERCISFLSR